MGSCKCGLKLPESSTEGPQSLAHANQSIAEFVVFATDLEMFLRGVSIVNKHSVNHDRPGTQLH